jgi:signal transduction histidine kinase
VFRIVQEALTNVARHARASQVKISARADSGNIFVSIGDDGRGIRNADLVDSHSWGIAGMRERAQYFGGALEIGGAPERGTRVVLRMPVGELGSETPL